MQKFLRVAQVALLTWTATAGAEVVPNLYQVDVPVAEQSAAELRRAASTGLAEVLVRVSGRADAEHNPALAPALAGADRYLDQYRFERNNAAGAQSWVARLHFAQNPSDQLLRGAGLPIWGANRPSLLVVLAFDEGKGRALVSESTHPALVAALREQAMRRGLSLHFPTADAADAQNPSVDDVWQLDNSRMPALTSRYHADALLLGRLSQSGRWSGSWNLVSNDQRSEADGEGDTLAAYLGPTFNRIADALAAQYAVGASGGASENILVRLAGVGNFNDYARALAYLQQLGGVKAVNPVQIQGDEVMLQLRVDGGAEQLSRQLALDSRIQPQATPAAATFGAQAVQLQLRWTASHVEPPAAG